MNAKFNVSKPVHIAIIMDGNGRWAKKRGLPRIAGHRAGVKTLRRLIEYAIKIKLNAITVYAFSQENWHRPEKEVDLLMELFMVALGSEVKDLHENNVCLKFVGDRSKFSNKLRDSIEQSESLTEGNSGLNLNVAANYSGRWDIVQACRAIGKDIATNKLRVNDINELILNTKLALANPIEPDLFIRTGGEQRISNYLLWQLAYTELYFTHTLWPDFAANQLDIALDWFSNRQRRFGKTAEQIEQDPSH